MSSEQNEGISSAEIHDAVVVGAGFAGLYALYRLRQLGLSVRVLEQGGDIGGTWYWNRYPGARCDVESLQYSYSFSDDIQQAWSWSERFASQSELLRYMHFVADRLDLNRDIELEARVVSAFYDAERRRWMVTTEAGRRLDTRFLVFATGCLSTPVEPDIPGLERFEGKVYRTSRWPQEPVDFGGRRVAVVGTGSSGIQAIPVIAEQAARLYVLQRTPNYSIPGYNGPMDPDFQRDWKANYAERRAQQLATRNYNFVNAGTEPGRDVPQAERERAFEARWRTGGLGYGYAYTDVTSDPEVNAHASDFVRRKIAETVRDSDVAARLQPTEYKIGGRRLCVDNGYYETFNRTNVTLIDMRAEPLTTMTPGGFATPAGEYAIDDLVLATGFDAFTGALDRIDIRGRDGLPLRRKWADGPANYLGLSVAGFPNMFLITGPGSPSVLSNMVMSIEQHVNWIGACIGDLLAAGHAVIEAKQDSEESWMRHIGAIAEASLIFKTRSWYTGANVSGKKKSYFMYMDGTLKYTKELNEAGRETNYAGFSFE
ncbi:MAG: NAD(P)/FAD-dependent oxidoreductase [Rhizobiaceae bacterium]